MNAPKDSSTKQTESFVDESATDPNAVFQAVVDEKRGEEVEAQMRRMSRRSFLWSALAIGGTVGGLKWISTRRDDNGIPWPLRHALDFNEEVARDTFRSNRLAPTFAARRVDALRPNGDIGLGDDFDASTWTLQVVGGAEGETQSVTLAQIGALPRFEMITELKCIEGWAVVNRWSGVRLADFIAKYPPTTTSGEPFSVHNLSDAPGFIGLATPDGAYYVGLEMEAALHPQTLLCTAMNGQPLAPEHGAPLRLAIPTKYGIKNIKRIGTLTFSNPRPADYWAEQGYDYHAGH